LNRRQTGLAIFGVVIGGLALLSIGATAPAPADGVVLEGMPAGLLDPRATIPAEDVPESVVRKDKSVCLSIADRPSAPGCPPEGWCGESAIQQALMYFGAYLPQKAINAAGRPRHPDLYAEEIPAAVKALGMGAAPCIRENRDYAAYAAWLRAQLDAGRPVIIGMKINPTEHPEWGLDHFLLAVGHTDDSLIFNTTWKKQRTATFKDLGTAEPDLSFKSRYNSYYGVAVTGPEGLGDGLATVRLFVAKEDEKQLTLTVKCEGLAAGSRYAAYRLSSMNQKTARPLCVFDAKSPVFAFGDTIAPADTAIYRCRKVK
jgi:hypothetical protein